MKPEAIPKSEKDYQGWMEQEGQISIDFGNVLTLSAGTVLAGVITKINEIVNIRK